MKNNKPNQDENTNEPLFGSEHLPQITIRVSQTCIDFREKPKEAILVDEGLYYASAIFNALMMTSFNEIHRDTNFNFAVRTLGFLGKTFSDIAQHNFELLEEKKR